MNASARGLALFDLDLTLLPIDSDHAWGEFVIGQGWVDAAAFRAGNDAFYAQYKRGRARHRRLHRLRRRAAARPEPGAARRGARPLHARGDRPGDPAGGDGARRRPSRARRPAGDRHLDQRLHHRADRRRVRHRDADRHPARARRRGPADRAASTGTPALREGKVARVGQWLAESGLGWDDFERISVYSDSPNDLPLLERATDPVAANPSPELEAVARERGWRIVRLFDQ